MRSRLLAPALAVGLLVAAAGPVATASPATGSWVAIGPASPALFPTASPAAVWGSRTGPDGHLYAFGSFSNAAGRAAADNLAVYDPTVGSWSEVGRSSNGDGALQGTVYDVAWLGSTLIAAGSFTNAGGNASADYLASWNGTSWGPVGQPGRIAFGAPVNTLDVLGGKLYAGGSFGNAGGAATADYLAVWDGLTWSGVGSNGAGNGALNGAVYKVDALGDGRVVAAGAFSDAGTGGRGDRIAVWTLAAGWQGAGSAAPDNALNGSVWDFAISGTRIYAVGSFTNAGGDPLADRVASWTGTAWTHLGSAPGGADGALNASAYGIKRYGTNVIVSGWFTDAGGVTAADGVAAWNGSKWLALGTPNPNGHAFGISLLGQTLTLAGAFTDLAGLAGADGVAAFGLPGVPGAPLAPAATAGSAKVTLNWGAPASANGASITDYTVQYRRSGTSTWATFNDGVSTARTAVVTGLAVGTQYDFRIAARNDWGLGASSTVVTARAG